GLADWAQVAVALAVIVSLLLALKDPLHGIARRMSTQDLRTTLEFALVAAVVLPILPNETIDPWGVVNPSQIWLLVVFVSGIGFGGYVLMKIVGTERDRKSTRLNSSHVKNSYAVFCLKKKK